MFISVLSSPCIQSRFIRSCNDLILAILSALDCHTSNSVAFWPALQCLSILLDRLGSRFWQFVPPTSNFDYVLKCILKSPHFQTELKKWNEETYQPCSPQGDPNNEDTAINCQVGFGYMERKLYAVKSEFHSGASFMTDPICMERLPFNWIIPFLHSLLDLVKPLLMQSKLYLVQCIPFPVNLVNVLPSLMNLCSLCHKWLNCFSLRKHFQSCIVSEVNGFQLCR